MNLATTKTVFHQSRSIIQFDQKSLKLSQDMNTPKYSAKDAYGLWTFTLALIT